jgi:hypothetical protein
MKISERIKLDTKTLIAFIGVLLGIIGTLAGRWSVNVETQLEKQAIAIQELKTNTALNIEQHGFLNNNLDLMNRKLDIIYKYILRSNK